MPSQKATKRKSKKPSLQKKNISKISPLESLEKKVATLLTTQEPREHLLSPRRSAFNLFFIAWTILMLDQFTKFLALIYLQPIERVSFLLFDLRYVRNTGAAFGIFSKATTLLTLVSLVFVIVVLGTILSLAFLPKNSWSHKMHRYTKHQLGTLSFGLLLGGAGGNLIDRAIRLYVIDFIDFHIWPVFNLADLCIALGVLGIVWTTFNLEKKQR